MILWIIDTYIDTIIQVEEGGGVVRRKRERSSS